MNQEQIKSPAFQNAELQSERLRIFGVLGFMTIVVIVTVVRVFVIHTAAATSWARTFFLVAVVMAYELWMLRKVGLALKSNTCLGPQFWILSTILETSIPAFAIAFLSSAQVEAVYRPLASPGSARFLYLYYIVHAAIEPLDRRSFRHCRNRFLHLRRFVPRLATAFSRCTSSGHSNQCQPLCRNASFGGLVAGAVAGQIRKHVQSALREAETKQKLEAVQHDLQVARSIQQSLLPRERPQIPGFDIAGWNQPADDTGGDYFDWTTLPDGKVIVSLADVTGHGIGPALLAAVCHAYARSNFSIAQNLPTAFEHINHELAADLGTGRFVTFVAAVCCPGCAEVEMLSAGHGPLFFYSRPEDRFMTMNAHALPLGLFPFSKSDPPARLQLHTGNLILLATDGFFEWENDRGEQFGVERMQGEIRASRDLPASEIISHLYDAVIRFSNGTKQQDDLTAVVIKGL